MPTWAWVLCILLAVFGTLLGLAALALLLFRVHYHLEWRGTLAAGGTGSARITYGFPGFQRTLDPFEGASWSLADLAGGEHPEDHHEEGTRKDGGGKTTVGRPARSDRNRMRRALFRLCTDPDAWKMLGRFAFKTAGLVLRLLNPKIEVAVGHPEPAFLGRTSGKWFAARPFLPFGTRTEVYFRFQDRHPSLWVRLEGRFSGLSVVLLGARLLIAFPSLRLAWSAVKSWRRHRLTGWRLWVYRRLQAAS
jgi:hypothetical protein